VLKAKWKRCDPVANSDTVFAGTGDNGYFVSRLSGNTVTSIEGIGNIDDWRRLEPALSNQAHTSPAGR
jgi:hypothetical protein